MVVPGGRVLPDCDTLSLPSDSLGIVHLKPSLGIVQLCQYYMNGGGDPKKTSIRIVLVHIKCNIKLVRVKFRPFSVFFTLMSPCVLMSQIDMFIILIILSWRNEFR